MAGVTQWTECQPMNQRVAGSIPAPGTCLGCRPGPPVWGVGGVQEATGQYFSGASMVLCPYFSIPPLKINK